MDNLLVSWNHLVTNQFLKYTVFLVSDLEYYFLLLGNKIFCKPAKLELLETVQ